MQLGFIIEVLFRKVNRIVKRSNIAILWMEQLDDMMKVLVALEMMMIKESLYTQRGRKRLESTTLVLEK